MVSKRIQTVLLAGGAFSRVAGAMLALGLT